jgi:hypothetical protein
LLRTGHAQQIPLWQLWTIIGQILHVLTELQQPRT